MMQNNLKIFPKIAVTGGYASGKSTVMKRFAERNYITASADEIYNNLLKNADFVETVSKLVGFEPLNRDGKILLDKQKVSEAVFNDKVLLAKFNSFTHEKVYQEIEKVYTNHQHEKIVFEIPLLFESKKEADFDYVLVVKRSLDSRISAGIVRDGLNEKSVLERINNQVNYDKIVNKAHTYITNDGSVEKLYEEVDKFIDKIEKTVY